MKEKNKNKDKKTEEKEIKEETVQEKKEETRGPSLEDLQGKIKELEENLAANKDQMLRHQAELENFKKRLLREKEEAVLFSNTKLIEELLLFMDNLERAIEAAKKTSDINGLTQGIQMIQDQLLGTLSKNWGLEKIKTEGCEFNPAEHEACMAVVDSELKSETVLQEFQTGYKLHDRVIRPAKVKIGKPE